MPQQMAFHGIACCLHNNLPVKLNADVTAMDTTRAWVTLHNIGNIRELSFLNMASLLAKWFAYGSKM